MYILNIRKQSPLLKIVLTVIVCCFAISCSQGDRSAVKKSSPESVIFNLQESAFDAKFVKVEESAQGMADGPVVFQRKGDLNYVLSELYHPTQVTIKNNTDRGEYYEIDIRRFSKTKKDSVKMVVRSKMQQHLNYTTTTDSIMRSKYRLSVVNEAKLAKPSAGTIPDGVESKIMQENGHWTIIATLPKLAEVLKEELDREVSTEGLKDVRYHFELQHINDVESLKNQLKNTYGLLLEGSEEPVQHVTITFGNA